LQKTKKDNANITRIINRTEEQGLLSKDKRFFYIYLTEEANVASDSWARIVDLFVGMLKLGLFQASPILFYFQNSLQGIIFPLKAPYYVNIFT